MMHVAAASAAEVTQADTTRGVAEDSFIMDMLLACSCCALILYFYHATSCAVCGRRSSLSKR